jgi:hypothetical protein
MVSPAIVNDRNDRFCQQRAELETVLASPLFQRAPKLSRILSYICERYFDGTAAALKEYSIAVDALGRAPGFDPQADAIVRVDLHLLRKRLEFYYAREGRHHAIRIVLPVGHYVPEFVPNIRTSAMDEGAAGADLQPSLVLGAQRGSASSTDSPAASSEQGKSDKKPLWLRILRRSIGRAQPGVALAIVSGILGIAIGAGGVLVLRNRTVSTLWMFANVPQPLRVASAEVLRAFSFAGPPDFEDKAIRIRCGSEQDYVDSSGFRWSADRDFAGGAEFHRNVLSILRSPDAPLYSTGRLGVFHYDIPVSPGIYEVHLLFAETQADVLDGMRQTSFIVGSAYSDTVDVESDAGGINTATMKIYPNVRPGANGKIHINFWSTDGFLNAIEILPQSGAKPGPIRISTRPELYTDLAGQHWLPDRYFMGGRNINNHTFSLERIDPPLLSRERYGNFNYAIPVAPGYSYQLTLYIAERYWGPQNSGMGGPGSRVFDVRCNDTELVHNLDLLKESANGTVAIRFRHLHPDVTGKLNLAFVPVTNYPLVNALEVDPE